MTRMNNQYKVKRQDILNYLNACIPNLLSQNDCIIDEKNKSIKVGHHLYNYHVTSDNKLIIVERKIKNGREILRIVTPNMTKAKKRKIKSQKGKVNSGKKMLYIMTTAALLSLAQAKYGAQNNTEEQIKIVSENKEIKINIPTDENAYIEQMISLPKNNLDYTDNKTMYEPVLNNTINIDISIDLTDTLGYEKRKRTEEKYGDLLEFYAKRRGLDKSFLIDLFTRERYNEIDNIPPEKINNIKEIFKEENIDAEEKVKANIGQLTRAICGEEIIAPIFENNKVIGYDKIYILPPSYDAYAIDSLEEMANSEKFSSEDLKKIKRASFLKNQGDWQIYKRKDAFYNVENNINVATAYLTYLINKKNDFIKGVMSYDAGYGSVPDSISYENILSGKVDAYDPYYISKILQYSPFNEGVYQCTIQFENESIVTYQFNNIKKLEEKNVEENGYHL